MLLTPLTEIQRKMIEDELGKIAREQFDIHKEIDENISKSGEFDRNKLSPKQQKLFDQLHKNQVIFYAYRDLLAGNKVLGQREDFLREKLSELNKKGIEYQQELDTLVAIQTQVLSILSK